MLAAVQKQHSSVAAELDRRESELTSLQMRHEALVREQGQHSNQVCKRLALQGKHLFHGGQERTCIHANCYRIGR